MTDWENIELLLAETVGLNHKEEITTGTEENKGVVKELYGAFGRGRYSGRARSTCRRRDMAFARHSTPTTPEPTKAGAAWPIYFKISTRTLESRPSNHVNL